MLPFSLGCAFTSAVAGIVVSRTGQYRPMMWGAFAVFTLGMGLMTMLDSHSSTYVFSFVFMGFLLHVAMQSSEGCLPVGGCNWTRMSVPGMCRSSVCVTVLGSSCLDTPHRSPGGNANKGYGHEYINIRIYQASFSARLVHSL